MDSRHTQSRRFHPSILAVLILLLFRPDLPQAQENDQADVPPGCLDGSFKCGLVFDSPAELASIPQDEANFVRHRGLPARIDLSADFPPVGRQGRQGSCVAWSTTYEVKSYLEKVTRRWNYDAGPAAGRCNGTASHVFSPAWTYNQINGGRDAGSSINGAFDLMIRKGAAPCSSMPYNDQDYRTQPNPNALMTARNYRSDRMTGIDCRNPDAVKAILSTGLPLVGGFHVTAALRGVGSGVIDTFDGNVTGGHAMAIVGYDDSIRSPSGMVGAFKLMNSWGEGWGIRGFGWIAYGAMPQFCKYSMVMYLSAQPTPPPADDTRVSAPRQVQASQGNFADRITVTWSDVPQATAYQLQRQNPGESSFIDLAFSQRASFDDSSVRPNAAYRYRIVTLIDNRKSDPEDSPVAEGFSRSQPAAPPSAVTGLSARLAADNSVTLSWTPASAAQSYRVYRRAASLETFTSQTAGYVDRQPPSGSVHYSVRGVNASGEGDTGEVVSVNVPGGGASPDRISGFVATRGTFRDKVHLNWQAASGANSYYLVRYDYETKTWDRIGAVNATVYDDTAEKIKQGKWYAYRLLASNSSGFGPWSDVQYGRAEPTLARAGSRTPPPENFRGNINPVAGRIELSWDAVPGAVEYYIFRKKSDDADFAFLEKTRSRNFLAALPEKNTLYYFAVRAWSDAGVESENSRPVAGFINELPPAVQSRLPADSGLSDLAGVWIGEDLQDFTLRRIRVTVSVTGNIFSAEIQNNGRTVGTARGTYAQTGSMLVDGGFRLTRLGDGRLVKIRINDRRFLPVELEIVAQHPQ